MHTTQTGMINTSSSMGNKKGIQKSLHGCKSNFGLLHYSVWNVNSDYNMSKNTEWWRTSYFVVDVLLRMHILKKSNFSEITYPLILPSNYLKSWPFHNKKWDNLSNKDKLTLNLYL